MNEMPSGVKIPDGANPYRAIVNGVEHAYEAGMITEVAPGVEELINAADNFPPAAEEVQPPFAGGGGGGGIFEVTFTATDWKDLSRGGTVDKSIAEIIAAIHGGKNVWLKVRTSHMPLVDWRDQGEYQFATFSDTQATPTSVFTQSVRISLEEGEEIIEASELVYPSTDGDEGGGKA